MSVNTAHTNNGVLLDPGESTLVLCGNVKIHFCGGGVVDVLKSGGDKSGSLYLTTHRMIFISKKEHPLKSFSFPFVAIRNLELEQPIFGTKGNYIKGHILPQPGGGFQEVDELKFKLYFKDGGAIDFGTAMLQAAENANNELDYSTGSPYPGINGASIHPKKDAPFDEARWKENSAKGNIFRRIMPHAQQKLTAVNVDPLIVDLKSTENYGHRFPKSPGISRNAIFVGKL